ncbi:MAG TPA: methionyl-tRNA formyltransferase [Gemmatimonadales bacterium]|jgi:methionyl-tRNA formyltransferase|nr:methionyl-tRNA formyltransferase [Gemmatimonadales bacterium]
MRFAWVGFHAEGLSALEALLASGAPIQAVLTLEPELAAKRSGSVDYGLLCERYRVPLYHIANINEPRALQILCALGPDVVFVIGWHQIVRPTALRCARLGMVGAHAALLPHNRGSAPINWALIRGEKQTGNTLIWLAEDVDAGEIIDQTDFPITPYDTCATLYEQVAHSNREMLLRLVPRLLAGQRPGRPQPHTGEKVLPRRRPADGLVDWTRPSQAVYDFVRGLTRPYPGAFSWLDGRRWFAWQAALPPAAWPAAGQPGEILGPVVSPVPEACGRLVACGEGTVVLLELEAEDGTVLKGRTLAEQPWTGKRWSNG